MAKQYYEPEYLAELQPKVMVFGTDFPAEIVYALTGEMPYWVIGGSPAFQAESDAEVPRDTDPVTRTALGLMMRMEKAKQSALVIVPCASDAQRKIAYYLQHHGWNTVTVWMPAVKDAGTQKGYESELEHAVRSICRHVGKRYRASRLRDAVRYRNTICKEVQTFLETVRNSETSLSDEERMLVLDTFFLCRDMEEWREQLKKLTASISERPCSWKPRVLVVGSPIYYPNYKLPSLLQEAGICLCGRVDARNGSYECTAETEGKIDLTAVTRSYFAQNTSSAFVRNPQWMDAIRKMTEETKPDGIIWHVLKGQIEYDFELNHCEPYFEQQDLPVIRLETDYQYQDIEQLRIRVEAFGELLTQRKKEKEKEQRNEADD